MKANVLATSRLWLPGVAERLASRTGRPFRLITEKDQLTAQALAALKPERVFLPHWSHRIAEEVYRDYECVIFHMTDVPFGRGGSPLQNLLARGIHETKISALRCAEEMDAGPVYLKRDFSLAQGSAQQLYEQASQLIEDMIVEIVKTNPIPRAQTGTPTLFKRRKPEESNLAPLTDLKQVYDHIRMLDADGYPPAFLEVGGLRLEFGAASHSADGVRATVKITRKEGSHE